MDTRKQMDGKTTYQGCGQANRLTDLLALSHVPRWTIVSYSRPQSVSDHVYRTLIIALELADRLESPLSPAAVRCIITHDADESRTGDIPTPAKRAGVNVPDGLCPWLSAPGLSSHEATIIGVADLTEAYTFIKMYGVGAHATRVADSLYLDMVNRCPDTWRAVLGKVVRAILTEEGR